MLGTLNHYIHEEHTMKTSDTHDAHITMALSPRYQRLAKEVLNRLPARWNSGRVVRLEESKETIYLRHGRPVVACGARLQFKSVELWVVTLYTSALYELSDEAVRWIIARELGRVASDASQLWRNRFSKKPVQEDTADAQALTWRFCEERRQCERECILPKAS
jgi:hypothetical protein